MTTTYDIMVIGGGPAGAAVSALLALRGMNVAVCEGKTFPREKVCGEFMGTRMRPVLQRLGLTDEFDQIAGPPVQCVAVCVPGEGNPLLGHMPPDAAGHYPRALGRGDFDAMLLRRARQCGATVHQPCHVIAITPNAASGFVAETSTGPLRAHVVILAHGLAQLGDLSRAASPKKLNRTYLNFKAHFADCDLPAATIAIAGTAGIYAGLTQTNRNRYSLAFVLRRERIQRLGNSPDHHLQALRAENPALDHMLRPARRISDWLASGPLEPGVRTLYSDGRFFVGNAAGEVHALVGEGITLALCGAEILAATIARFGLHRLPEAGKAYELAWRRQFAGRYHAAQLFANLMMRPNLSGIASKVMAAWPELLDLCIRRTGK